MWLLVSRRGSKPLSVVASYLAQYVSVSDINIRRRNHSVTNSPTELDGWMDGGRSGLTQLAIPLAAAAAAAPPAVLTDNSAE